MYQAKTTENHNSVVQFVNAIQDEQQRIDSFLLVALMEKISGCPAKMWGTAIIGFGTYHYKYTSGHEGDAPLLGFSPRKAGLSIYLSCESPADTELFSQLGKHKMAKACLSIKRLSDVDLNVLETILRENMEQHC